MKKFVTYAVMLAYLTVTLRPVQAQQQPFVKPKVAIYVAEHSDYSREQKSALRTVTLNTLVRDGRYNVIERSDIIEAELKKQASGAVDDDRLTAFGRQAGVPYICIADMTYIPHRNSGVDPKYQVSVRMVDVETAEVLGFGLETQPIGSGPRMTDVITSAVNKMLRTVQPPKSANMPKMAVYVTGGSKGQRPGNALYSYTLEALFTRSRNLGTFTVVERSDAFTRQIDREMATQRSGHVDDSQITRLGKQYGIERILVVSMNYAMSSYNISSRIINIETADVENASSIMTAEADYLASLGWISTSMVEEMMGITNAEKKKKFWTGVLQFTLLAGMVTIITCEILFLPKKDTEKEGGRR